MLSISYNFIRCLNTFTFQISLQVRAGEEIQLRCESQGGNPAPILKWYIDNQELDGSIQKMKLALKMKDGGMHTPCALRARRASASKDCAGTRRDPPARPHPDMHVSYLNEAGATRMFPARLRQARVDGNSAQR